MKNILSLVLVVSLAPVSAFAIDKSKIINWKAVGANCGPNLQGKISQGLTKALTEADPDDVLSAVLLMQVAKAQSSLIKSPPEFTMYRRLTKEGLKITKTERVSDDSVFYSVKGTRSAIRAATKFEKFSWAGRRKSEIYTVKALAEGAKRGGHQLVELETGKVTNEALKDWDLTAYDAAGNSDGAMVANAYRIKEVSPKKPGEKIADTLKRVIKYSLHRDFPVTGNEDGYDLDRLKKSATLQDILGRLSQFDAISDTDEFAKKIMRCKNQGLLVFIGAGSGNNTSAQIIVIADPETMEFSTLVQSNFGGDT